MRTPLPIRLVESLITRTKYPVITVGVTVFLPLFLLFVITGAIYPVGIQPWTASPLEITGLMLLMAIMPAYLLMCLIAASRLNDNAHLDIVALLDSPEQQEQLRYRWFKFWPLAVLLGIAFAWWFNIGWETLSFESSDPRFWTSICIVWGQLVMWSIVGIVLFYSIHESWVLNRLGRSVRVDLYHLDSLNGFGRAALSSLLMIAGALSLTLLQSLDQDFRWENYGNALAVGIPAVLIMVPLPIWQLHLRIRRAKHELMAKLDVEMSQTSASLDDAALQRMNALLIRKEQIHKLRNWPMDLSIFSRLILYVFIPPLAWTGAALMEVFLDGFLAG